MQKITVGRMNLDGVQSQPGCAPRRRRERLANALQTGCIQGTRWSLAFLVWHGRGRENLPSAFLNWNLLPTFPRHIARAFASRVGKLNAHWNLREAPDRLENRLDCGIPVVVPDSQAAGSNPAR